MSRFYGSLCIDNCYIDPRGVTLFRLLVTSDTIFFTNCYSLSCSFGYGDT